MRVAIDAGTVGESVFFRNGRRGAPADKGVFNLFPLVVSSDRASPLVASKVHSCIGLVLLTHNAIVI